MIIISTTFVAPAPPSTVVAGRNGLGVRLTPSLSVYLRLEPLLDQAVVRRVFVYTIGQLIELFAGGGPRTCTPAVAPESVRGGPNRG